MSKNNDLAFEAVVTGIQKTFYTVEVKNVPVLEGKTIKAKLSGKMRMNKIRVIIGDKVTVQLNPYDLTENARITYRTK